MYEGNQFKVPTVRVKSADAPDGFVVINESDFDPAVHVMYEDAPTAPLPPPPAA